MSPLWRCKLLWLRTQKRRNLLKFCQRLPADESHGRISHCPYQRNKIDRTRLVHQQGWFHTKQRSTNLPGRLWLLGIHIRHWMRNQAMCNLNTLPYTRFRRRM